MPAVTRDAIRELAGYRGERAPVTSCYLDVDGRRHVRHQDFEHELDVLLRDARAQANGDASVAADLRRIEEYVKAGVDRSSTRGLAMFSCSAHDLWQVIALPVPVRNRVVVNHMPAVGQLEGVVQEYERIGVLLVDRQRARMFVFELGELIDHSELFDELPRDYDDRGERERGDTQHHVEALARAAPAPRRRGGVGGVPGAPLRAPGHRRARRHGAGGRSGAAPVPARPRRWPPQRPRGGLGRGHPGRGPSRRGRVGPHARRRTSSPGCGPRSAPAPAGRPGSGRS